MSDKLTLEEEHRLLKELLRESLEKKRSMELRIGTQFAELKKMEISLEKMRITRRGGDCSSSHTFG
jgi:hypothetical protein